MQMNGCNSLLLFLIYKGCFICFVKVPLKGRKYSNEAALSLRSRRSGTKRTDHKGLFAKCRRLPRGFFWNYSLPSLVN